MKKYGTVGLMEWVAVIKAGKSKFSFHFSGGTLTGYGVTPAIFETDNELYQQVIEDSDFFKRGKIQLLATEGSEAESAATESTGALETVNMPTVKDARQFLIDGYKVEASKLLRKDDVVRYGRSKGIEFVFGTEK